MNEGRLLSIKSLIRKVLRMTKFQRAMFEAYADGMLASKKEVNDE